MSFRSYKSPFGVLSYLLGLSFGNNLIILILDFISSLVSLMSLTRHAWAEPVTDRCQLRIKPLLSESKSAISSSDSSNKHLRANLWQHINCNELGKIREHLPLVPSISKDLLSKERRKALFSTSKGGGVLLSRVRWLSFKMSPEKTNFLSALLGSDYSPLHALSKKNSSYWKIRFSKRLRKLFYHNEFLF